MGRGMNGTIEFFVPIYCFKCLILHLADGSTQPNLQTNTKIKSLHACLNRTSKCVFLYQKMPRNWKKKTDRVRASIPTIKEAVNEVLTKGMSIRNVAKAFNMSKSTLSRHVTVAKQIPTTESYEPNPDIGNRRIFSVNEENELCGYLKTCSQMCYGLTTIQTRKLAFEFANFLGKAPVAWQENEIAGKDWLSGFLDRQRELSIRTPESTSQARACSFNKNNVSIFFQKLEGLLQKYKFEPADIYNCDETGLSTVTECPKIIATKGTKQVGQITSAERGQLVTMLNFINAIGNTIPPVYVFPRVNFKNFMIENGPSGSLGLAHPSGWMTAENFRKSMEHFVKYTKCTKEKPVLLIIMTVMLIFQSFPLQKRMVL
ncbi:uncharacterized protein [Parasteatoda tepidariorum]|uniref:uncharacterized protein n=1 Tax=Parasteatoda tepidariorum TaxID=114398 RepID=UPI001C721136|nr:uncharacterized protein LOC122272946 isoform X1 [Parasteatoda tepidariorum]